MRLFCPICTKQSKCGPLACSLSESRRRPQAMSASAAADLPNRLRDVLGTGRRHLTSARSGAQRLRPASAVDAPRSACSLTPQGGSAPRRTCRHNAVQNDDMVAARRGCPSLLVRLDKSVGETKANMIRSRAVALRTCTVSFTGPSGVRHSVEVTAESIYEAAALGVSALKNSWLGRRDRAGNRARGSGARARHLSSAHRAADSSLVRRRRGQPRRDAEEATIEATARLSECGIEAAVA